MEQPIISGVAADLNDAKITIVGVIDEPGVAAKIFQALANAGVNIDMIVQNVSEQDTKVTDISFTLPKADAQRVLDAIASEGEQIGYASLRLTEDIGKISLVGSGMRTNIGVTAKLFTALKDAGINIDMISTSEIRISIITQADLVTEATCVIHTAFDLDGDAEAVVYAGTGR